MRFKQVMCLLALIVPGVASSKGEIVSIQIDDGTPLLRTVQSSELAGRFSIWGSPATASAASGARDFADWYAGAVPEPASVLPRTTLTLICKEGPQREVQPCHRVLYVYDPAAGHGFIYLPGDGEEGYRLNVRHIRRGVEGKWFKATTNWDALMRLVSVPRARADAPARHPAT